MFDKQAMALQWAIYLMQKSSIDENNNALVAGRAIAINCLLPFATELALKGLSVKERPSAKIERTHDLHRLFAYLPQDVIDSVDERFLRYQKDDPIQISTPSTMDVFLAEHKDDFEAWRYLDNVSDMATPEPVKFQYALCALLDEIYE